MAKRKRRPRTAPPPAPRRASGLVLRAGLPLAAGVTGAIVYAWPAQRGGVVVLFAALFFGILIATHASALFVVRRSGAVDAAKQTRAALVAGIVATALTMFTSYEICTFDPGTIRFAVTADMAIVCATVVAQTILLRR
jgi:hypothetical protein